jgi:hypothetical protein
MKPLLKGQDCVDHDPIEAWQPTDPADVNYSLCLHIGPAEQQGADLFYVNILSEAAAFQLDVDGIMRRKKVLIVTDYSWDAVMDEVDLILHKVEGASWVEIAQKLGQCFDWEFENYRPHQPGT